MRRGSDRPLSRSPSRPDADALPSQTVSVYIPEAGRQKRDPADHRGPRGPADRASLVAKPLARAAPRRPREVRRGDSMLRHACSVAARSSPRPPPRRPIMPRGSPRATSRLRDFRFRSGETLPELRIHYATLGTPAPRRRRRDRQCGDGPARHRRHAAASSCSRNSPTSCTAPASRSTSPAITSSSPTASATAARPSRATACACASRITIMTTWSRRSG